MRSRLRSVASRLASTVVPHRRRNYDRYQRLTPCERGSYYRAPSAGEPSNGQPGSPADSATVVITATGSALFDITVSFLDGEWPIYVVDGSRRCYGLPALQHAIENLPARWCVLLDEDCFIMDNARLRNLIAWASARGYAAVGVPDGGVIPRRDHNPNALNLFFNVLDLAAIREVWDPDQCESWMNRGSEMTHLWPPASLMKPDVPYVFDDYEPYYCFYFWLREAGLSTGYLGARLHSDGLSAIVLDHAGSPMAIHSWYAREFDDDHGPMRERILDVVDYAQGGEDRGERWRGRF